MNFRLVKQIRENDPLRENFFRLAEQVFGLNFRDWYRKGFWTDQYIPYVMADGERVAANVSVNIMNFVWHDVPKHYVQLGTVMTDPAYRGQGLARTLLEEVLKDWAERCDCLYLFANSSVLDFYPKFGFARTTEYQYIMRLDAQQSVKSRFRKLNMKLPEDRALFHAYCIKPHPFSVFSMKDNYGLLMFYCDSFLKDCIYYSQDADAVCVAAREGDGILCYDIFGGDKDSMTELLHGLADAVATNAKQVFLGFTPANSNGCSCAPVCAADDALFLLSGKESIFQDHPVMFPLLSHA